MDEQTAGLNETASASDDWPSLLVDGDGVIVESETPATGAGITEPNVSVESETPESVPATDTTEDAGESNPQAGDEPAPKPEPEPAQKPSPRILKYRDNHTEHEFNVTDATDAQLIEQLQKAKQYDRLKAAQAEHADAEKFREYIQKTIKPFLEDGEDINRAKALAGMLAQTDGLKVYPFSVSEDGVVTLSKNYLEIPELEPAPVEPAAQESAPEPMRKNTDSELETQLRQLRALYPKMTEIPADVLKLHRENGIPLTTAMIHVENQRIKAYTAELEKENRTLKQNADAAARAPVRGVSGGGVPAPSPEEDDPFLTAFLKNRY